MMMIDDDDKEVSNQAKSMMIMKRMMVMMMTIKRMMKIQKVQVHGPSNSAGLRLLMMIIDLVWDHGGDDYHHQWGRDD